MGTWIDLSKSGAETWRGFVREEQGEENKLESLDTENGISYVMADLEPRQVTYFKQRRVMEHNKKMTLEKLAKEGAKSMPEGMGPPGVQGKSPQ